MRLPLVCCVLIACFAQPCLADQPLLSFDEKVVSPDGAVQFNLFSYKGRLKFAVQFKKQSVIEPSPLDFVVDGRDQMILTNTKIGSMETIPIRESYPWRGVHSQAVNDCIAATLKLGGDKPYYLDIRAFNDGVAFRFRVPGNKEQRTPDEATTFVLPKGCTAWYHNLRGHYEGVHDKKNMDTVKAEEWAAPPVTIKLPGNTGYASITEANLINYSGMALQTDGKRGLKLQLGHAHPASYPFELRYKEDIDRLKKPAIITGPIATPWRVVLIGADLNTLVNSDIIHNLCPPPDPRLFPKGFATEWIKPGRTVWRYLDGGQNNYQGMKDFCKWAGELGFEYNVIENVWSMWSDTELRDLVKYGKERGVGLFLWKHSKDLRDPAKRAAFFKKCQDAGAAGVKIDFFDHDHKEVIDHYFVLLREAAEHKLMVNFHGSTKPCGESRTWPNEVVRESVRGMESKGVMNRAFHDANLPFTRFLAGHADYTPVHFGDRRADTTWAHQVATAVVFTAPLMLYAANPKTMLENPCAPMIKTIPTVWDETIVLPFSEISECAAFARRKGDTWFLGIINGPMSRTVRVPLSFLGKGDYQAALIRDDAKNPAAARVENNSARNSDTLVIELSNGGGFVGRFSKK